LILRQLTCASVGEQKNFDNYFNVKKLANKSLIARKRTSESRCAKVASSKHTYGGQSQFYIFQTNESTRPTTSYEMSDYTNFLLYIKVRDKI
jgi:hypothetical protein